MIYRNHLLPWYFNCLKCFRNTTRPTTLHEFAVVSETKPCIDSISTKKILNSNRHTLLYLNNRIYSHKIALWIHFNRPWEVLNRFTDTFNDNRGYTMIFHGALRKYYETFKLRGTYNQNLRPLWKGKKVEKPIIHYYKIVEIFNIRIACSIYYYQLIFQKKLNVWKVFSRVQYFFG